MQVNAFRFTPATRPQASRFGHSEITQAQKTAISAEQVDPEFMAALNHNKQALNNFYNAVQNGTVEFVSAKEGLKSLAKIKQQAVWPEITFKLNQKPYVLTIQSLHSQKGIAYEIHALEGERSEFEFVHFPKGIGMSYTSINMAAYHQGQSKMMTWDAAGSYYPKSEQGAYTVANFPHPDMVAKASELGKLLLTKLGESRQAQGLGPLALPEPPKQLDHPA